MILTLRELRHKLAVGVEYIGTHNPTSTTPVIAKRIVKGQNSKEMVSTILEGMNKDRDSYLTWANMQATQSGDDIFITKKGDSVPFFKINILPKA